MAVSVELVDEGGPNRTFGALADEQRRTALAVLHDAGNALPVSDLAIEVARRERENLDVDDAAHKVHCMMFHCHLPKLAEAGLVEYDREDQRVALSADAVENETVSELLSSE